MNPKDWIDLLQRLFAWLSERRNPVPMTYWRDWPHG
ncbi:hypothetical protein SSTU70S_03039 [Stutzerimonas stutzeri]